MRAMILAAGFGTRLRPLTDRVPKPLLTIAGHPMIAYPLAILRAAGIREVLINLHHHGEQIRDILGDGSAYGMRIEYSAEDPILDTGGAIKKAEPFLRGDTFVVMNSDILIDLRLADAGISPKCDPRYDSFIDHVVLDKRAGADMLAFAETLYALGEKHYSDHCPVMVTLAR